MRWRRRGEGRFTFIYFVLLQAFLHHLHDRHRHPNRFQSRRTYLTRDPRSRLQPKRAGPTPRPLRGAPGPTLHPTELAGTLRSTTHGPTATPTASRLGAQVPVQFVSSASPTPPRPPITAEHSAGMANPAPPPSALPNPRLQTSWLRPRERNRSGVARCDGAACGGRVGLCTCIKELHT